MSLSLSTLYITFLSLYSIAFGDDDIPFTASDIDLLRVVTLNKIDSFGNIDDGPELKPLIGSIVRLVFHDCSGPYNPGNIQSSHSKVDNTIRLCDGCIDLASVDHKGLQQLAVEPIQEICNEFADKLNTADCWAAVGTIALEYAASLSNTPGTLPTIPYFIGRIPCAWSPNAVISPTTHFPSPHKGWDQVFDFFEIFFDFDLEETTAIMGAHTLGRAHVNASGFHGRWTLDSWALNNRFFIELLDKSNEWDQKESRGHRSPQWGNKGRAEDEEELFMLNVDISIIADFEDDEDDGHSFIKEESGIVDCRWEGFNLFPVKLCPRERSFKIALTYAIDNQRFLRDFSISWEKLVTNNYHDLIEITPNPFHDTRGDEDEDEEITPTPTNVPVVSTSFPSASPTKTPTIKRITPETTDVEDTSSAESNYCCMAKRKPNWNGRCWGKLNEEDCFNAGNGRRCVWDSQNCRQTQTCSLRGDKCSVNGECCSQRCRQRVQKCR